MKEHRAKQKWPRETHSITCVPGLSTLSDLSRIDARPPPPLFCCSRPPSDHPLLLLLLLLLLKKVGSARLIESDIHFISPKTPAPHKEPIDRKKRKGKIVEDFSRDRAAYGNKKALAQLSKPASHTPSNTGLARLFQRDTERGIKVLLYCDVLQRGGA